MEYDERDSSLNIKLIYPYIIKLIKHVDMNRVTHTYKHTYIHAWFIHIYFTIITLLFSF